MSYVISQIFQLLTRKDINNSMTLVQDKSPQDLFIEQKNISYLTTSIYNRMVVVNRPDYHAFRLKISKLMNDWIWKQPEPADDVDREYPLYVMQRYNQNFIDQHQYLVAKPCLEYATVPKMSKNGPNYGCQTETYCNVLPQNVYRDKFIITSRNPDGSLSQEYKKGADMMPSDYQNWDVWKKRDTYADFDFEKFRSFRDRYGYAGTYIPRNVDRDPNSFGLVHRDPMRASLSDTPRAYDNSEYFKAKGIQ